MITRIIGIGAPAGGDDGVGLVVLEHLRREIWPAATELHAVADPSSIVLLLGGADLVILVDAVLGVRPGEVRQLQPEFLARGLVTPVSTHGVSVTQALELARRLGPGSMPRRLAIVGIGIGAAAAGAQLLSASVQAAVPCAVALVRAIAQTGMAAPGAARDAAPGPPPAGT